MAKKTSGVVRVRKQFRLPERTVEQIQALIDHRRLTETDVVIAAVDAMATRKGQLAQYADAELMSATLAAFREVTGTEEAYQEAWKQLEGDDE